ncbi:hypothetical protein BD324DRAFT_648628 [Kockovaella imperatae]|uniref:Uncharacterized protein n=1 Tax=Kockovaella imperatae TaxID=4999 RepID=A0A1Y1URA3_9TREE|nr:hypothetical protein BD324DRAFT_648628 [Kockovaella imperatae]ORX40014.1 hypothetical protein BD324DRAFT_648628 [Kockovaella imperatae]
MAYWYMTTSRRSWESSATASAPGVDTGETALPSAESHNSLPERWALLFKQETRDAFNVGDEETKSKVSKTRHEIQATYSSLTDGKKSGILTGEDRLLLATLAAKETLASFLGRSLKPKEFESNAGQLEAIVTRIHEAKVRSDSMKSAGSLSQSTPSLGEDKSEPGR